MPRRHPNVIVFFTDQQRWGYPFRRGLFEVDADDMAVIREALTGVAVRQG